MHSITAKKIKFSKILKLFFDDCSTDNSLKIVNKYKNIKIMRIKITRL